MAPAPAPEKSLVPNWLKWAGLILLGIGAGLFNVTTDPHGHVGAFDVIKNVFVSLGVTLTGGAVNTRG